MDYKLILTIIIAVILLLSLLNYNDYLNSLGIIVSLLVIGNIIIILLIKIYDGRGFLCSSLSTKSSKHFSFETEFENRSINYLKNSK